MASTNSNKSSRKTGASKPKTPRSVQRTNAVMRRIPDNGGFYLGGGRTALGTLQDGLLRIIHSRPAADMTLRQVAILNGIYHSNDQHTVRDLSSYLNMTKPAVTRAVQRLETLGFATKRLDDADHRVIRVSITAKGAAWLEQIESGETAEIRPPTRQASKPQGRNKTTRMPAGAMQQGGMTPTHPSPSTTH